MPRVGFEPTTPVFERAKIVHALDRAATVIGFLLYIFYYILWSTQDDYQNGSTADLVELTGPFFRKVTYQSITQSQSERY
jgi:hypothetical protein